ncbi:hypothetical protein GLOIN_2v1777839 [Rhizophagus irregularis DAOM 181602=DAOM 197198]|nr:hypothetical protein GLOIN_2v1777839 [Rhizophagus irregularis DAOM 181602=DAOM 197198]
MFRQVWIGGKKSTGYWNLNKEIGSDLDTRSPIDFGSALDIWVSASSSWTLDGFRLSVFGRLILFRLLVLGRLLLISAFGSWIFQLLVPGVKYINFGYQFRLSVLGRLLLISAFGSWIFWLSIYRFRLSVLGHLILVSAFSSWTSYAFDLKLSVMAATSHWALDRFRLQYLLKLWVSAVISLGIEMVSAAISLDL